MPGEIIIEGTDEEQALNEALKRLGLPREAVEYEVQAEAEEDLLPGAKPRLQVHVRVKPEFIADKAFDHVVNLLEILNLDAEVEQDVQGDIVFIRIDSDEGSSILIGRQGQTLDALQYLITRMCMRVGREAPMIVVDVANYRRRQFDKLKRLAKRAIDRARETGNEIELDPMPAIERKYLHYILRDEEDIRTFSRGEEPERSLVIIAD